MPPVGFEPTISEGERPQTYVLDRAATGTGSSQYTEILKYTKDFYQLYTVVGSLVCGLGRLQRYRVFNGNSCLQIIKRV